MSKPSVKNAALLSSQNPATQSPTAWTPPEVTFYIVVAPGKNPEMVQVTPKLEKLTWNFGQMERGELIDQVEKVAEYMSSLEKWLKAAREVLKQTLPRPTADQPEIVVSGRYYEAHYTRTLRRDIDRELIKRDMGEEWYQRHCKETEVFMLKIVPITQTPGVAG